MCIWWNIIFILLQRFYPVDLSPLDAWCSLKWKEHPLNHSLFPHCQCSIQMTLHGTHTSVIALCFLSQLFEKGQLLTTKKKCPAFWFWLFIWFELWSPSTSLKPFLKTKNQTRKSLNNRTHPPWFLPSWRLYRPQSIACGSLIEDPMVFLIVKKFIPTLGSWPLPLPTLPPLS